MPPAQQLYGATDKCEVNCPYPQPDFGARRQKLDDSLSRVAIHALRVRWQQSLHHSARKYPGWRSVRCRSTRDFTVLMLMSAVEGEIGHAAAHPAEILESGQCNRELAPDRMACRVRCRPDRGAQPRHGG